MIHCIDTIKHNDFLLQTVGTNNRHARHSSIRPTRTRD